MARVDQQKSAIAFEHVSYQLDNGRFLLSDLTFDVPTGKLLVLLGSSGSGKTTSLKLINRLLVPTSGSVRVEGRSTLDWNPIELRRKIGYAIQDVGLFPHYTVRQNVAMLPKLQGWSRQRLDDRTEEVLRIVGLDPKHFASRYVDQLSGGQKQRVGLARALAADPPILLMDEPFGALDPISRAQLQRDFQELRRALSKTVVFVTHDVSEALLLADEIALLSDGKLCGRYTPNEFLISRDPAARTYVEIARVGQERLRPTG